MNQLLIGKFWIALHLSFIDIFFACLQNNGTILFGDHPKVSATTVVSEEHKWDFPGKKQSYP